MLSISQGSFRFTAGHFLLLIFAFSAAAVADRGLSHLLAQQVVVDLNQLQDETAQSNMQVRLSALLNKRLERVKHEVEAGVRMILGGREAKALTHFRRALIHINHYQAMLSERVAVGEVSKAVTNSLSADASGIVQNIEQLIDDDWQNSTLVADYATYQFAQQVHIDLDELKIGTEESSRG
jgi:hypothetical protein